MGRVIFDLTPCTEPQPCVALTLADLPGSKCDAGPWEKEGMTQALLLFSSVTGE